jgi:ATP-binding cassette, subfamily C (CFTR/MRP), member 4
LRRRSGNKHTSLLSNQNDLSFRWTKEIFQKGSKQYDDSDIYLTRKAHKSKDIFNLFDRLWKEELQKPNPSMLRTIYRAYGAKTILLGLIFSVQETANR